MSKFYLNLVLFLFFSSALSAQNAQTIINKYIEAIGGREKLESIQNFYDSTQTWSLQDIFDPKPQLEAYQNIRIVYADQLGKYGRCKAIYKKDNMISHFISDGTHTTYITYMNEQEIYRRTRDISGEWSFESLFNGFRLLQASKRSYQGKQIENGKEYYVLRIEESSKQVTLWYFNTDTHLLEKSHLDEPNPRFTSHYLDYQEIDGLLIPMVKETRNAKGDLVMRFEKIKVQFNLDLPDDLFTLE